MTERFRSEWEFTQEVIKLAKEYRWEEPFHIPAQAYRDARIPEGFPDLLLRYRDEEGRCTMIVAELKTDDKETSKPTPAQLEFLEDFASQNIPTFILRYKDWEYIIEMLRGGPPAATGGIIEPSPPIARSREWLPPKQTIDAVIPKLVDDIGDPNFSRGDLAALRRMDMDSLETVAPFWQLLAHRGLSCNPGLDSQWALIMHGIALMTPAAHDSRVPVGQALFEGGDSTKTDAFYSRLRLNRMLTAHGSVLRALLAQMFRMMRAKQPFDWREMAWFILSEETDSKGAEEARMKIARAYYSAEYRKSPQGNS